MKFYKNVKIIQTSKITFNRKFKVMKSSLTITNSFSTLFAVIESELNFLKMKIRSSIINILLSTFYLSILFKKKSFSKKKRRFMVLDLCFMAHHYINGTQLFEMGFETFQNQTIKRMVKLTEKEFIVLLILTLLWGTLN